MIERKYMTEEQLKQFFSVIEDHRDKVMFKLIYYYGLRIGEARLLKVDDILFGKDNAIRITALKNGVSGMYSLIPEIHKMLKKYIEAYKLEKDSPLFLSKKGGQLSNVHIWRLFKKYATKAKIPKDLRNPHVLRHSIAVHMADKGYPVEGVQMHLRHKSISNTMIYYQITSKRRRELQTFMLNGMF